MALSSTPSLAAEAVLQRFMSVDGVVSASIVGSWAELQDPSSASDIDVIVVCKQLSRSVYDNCLAAASTLSGKDFGCPERRLHINPTFGPLKFHDRSQVVLHLMLYDVAGHRDHVLKSPFTCYDWERSTLHAGLSLSEIYPVLKLQPRDFTDARRSLQDYLQDLSKGCISYRQYSFGDGSVQQTYATKTLDARDTQEYAYHIVKNLVGNYLKLVRDENVALAGGDLADAWRTFLPRSSAFIPFFLQLQAAKRSGGGCVDGCLDLTRQFLGAFRDDFDQSFAAAPRHCFLRHAKTELNDGTFLGCRRDPSIATAAGIEPLGSVGLVVSSPLKRALETAARLAPHTPVRVDPRLSEMDYGEAEGLTLAELCARHPDICKAWQQQGDPRFPGGENTSDVRQRLLAFLTTLREESKDSLVVTHNVVLRCLAGQLFGITPERWYRMQIPHLGGFEVVSALGRFFPNLSPQSKTLVTDAVSGFTLEPRLTTSDRASGARNQAKRSTGCQ